MSDISISAPTQAKSMRAVFRTVTACVLSIAALWRRRHHPHVRDLNAHLARDAGVEPPHPERPDGPGQASRPRHPML
ncbi:hypothetical protein [Sulfitobacter sp. THAF37]|uniref:hypothetical protein n=1 Tax=Sulfitobacter sp. THAF37 TaxID=2587855 RepID=UPI001267D510|nr:hypothetical protein [Sulfitobacter sp. THAF37]